MSNDANRIREYIQSNFPLVRERALADHDSLLEGGVVDSLGVLDIVTFLESELGIEMSDDDLMADTFETIAGIVSFVEQKKKCVETES